MTLHFLTWAFDARVKTPAELAALLVIASSSDQNGDLAISRQSLADRARMRPSELDEIIDSLEDGGFIKTFDPHDWSKVGVRLKVNGQ
jgi:DNA-binding MarR family transcriptional regulator